MCAAGFGQTHTLVTNLQYRLTNHDLGEVTPAPFRNARTLRIQQGGELLLHDCADHPEKCARDTMLFRLAHRHAASSTSFREYASPSMHVVSHPLPDGTVETRIHFDLHGPRDLIGHTGEVVKNRPTFGRTSEYEAYRRLVENRNDPGMPVPPPPYDFSRHDNEHLKAT